MLIPTYSCINTYGYQLPVDYFNGVFSGYCQFIRTQTHTHTPIYYYRETIHYHNMIIIVSVLYIIKMISAH